MTRTLAPDVLTGLWFWGDEDHPWFGKMATPVGDEHWLVQVFPDLGAQYFRVVQVSCLPRWVFFGSHTMAIAERRKMMQRWDNHDDKVALVSRMVQDLDRFDGSVQAAQSLKLAYDELKRQEALP